jgi:hypothetical protein
MKRLTFALTVAALTLASVSTAQCAPKRGYRVESLIRRLRGSGRYMDVKVIWRGQPSDRGPVAIVEGEWGGSAGIVDLYGLSSSASGLRTLTLPDADRLAVRTVRGRPAFDAPFVVDRFNGASNAASSSVPLPIVWRLGDFQLDLQTLQHRHFNDQDLRFRRIAVCRELNQWANNLDPAKTIYPAPPNALDGTPTTVQALMDLMLTGNVSKAKDILDTCWPSTAERTDVQAGGEQAFWNDLARALRRNALWERFHLARLPDSRIIEMAAARAEEAAR